MAWCTLILNRYIIHGAADYELACEPSGGGTLTFHSGLQFGSSSISKRHELAGGLGLAGARRAVDQAAVAQMAFSHHATYPVAARPLQLVAEVVSMTIV